MEGREWGVGSPCKFSSLTDVFASVIVSFPPNFVIRVSFCFLASKVTELLRGSLFPFFIAHRAWSVSDGYLFVQSSCSIILIERLNPIDKTWFFYNKQKKIGNVYFSKNCFNCKNTSMNSNKHHTSVQKSVAISGLSFVT